MSLAALGEDFPNTEERKLELVFKLVRSFKDKFTQGINGKYFFEHVVSKNKENSETMIYKLNTLFAELFEEYSKRDYKASAKYTD